MQSTPRSTTRIFCQFLLLSCIANSATAQRLEVRTRYADLMISGGSGEDPWPGFGKIAGTTTDPTSPYTETLTSAGVVGGLSASASSAIAAVTPHLNLGESLQITGSASATLDKGDLEDRMSSLISSDFDSIIELHERSTLRIEYSLNGEGTPPNGVSYPNTKLALTRFGQPYDTLFEVRSNPDVGPAAGSIDLIVDPGLYEFDVQGVILLFQGELAGSDYRLPPRSELSVDFDVSLTLLPVPSPAATLPLSISMGVLATRRRRN